MFSLSSLFNKNLTKMLLNVGLIAFLTQTIMGCDEAPQVQTAKNTPVKPTDYATKVIKDGAETATRILVKFNSNVGSASRARSLLDAGLSETGTFSLVPGLTIAEPTPGLSVIETLTNLENDNSVAYAEPDMLFSIVKLPSDAGYYQQYGLNNTGQTGGIIGADINAEAAWDIQTGNNIVVAVIDSGVDYNHEDLINNIWTNVDEIPDNGIDDDKNGYIDDVKGWDFSDHNNDPMDQNDHGTHVAGVIGASGDNDQGIAGINWNVKIMPLKFMNSNGQGRTSAAISALEYAIANGAKISNNSWGGENYSQALFDAIQVANRLGHIVVAAAGNAGSNNDRRAQYPSSYDLPNIISVGASDDKDKIANFSNYGRTSVDILAPGVEIYSTVVGDGYRRMSGTSMSAPFVTGVAALLLAQKNDLTITEVKTALLINVDSLSAANNTVSGGRLNAAASLASIGRLVVPSNPEVVEPVVDPISSSPATPNVDIGAPNTSNPSIPNPSTSNPPINTVPAVVDTPAVTTPITDPIAIPITDPAINEPIIIDPVVIAPIILPTIPVAPAIPETPIEPVVIPTVPEVDPVTVPITTPEIVPVLPEVTPEPMPVIPVVEPAPVVTVPVEIVPVTPTPIEPPIEPPIEIPVAPAPLPTSPVITEVVITPNVVDISIGVSAQLSATGGVAPYTWSVDNIELANIDINTGIINAVAEGTVLVLAVDSTGLQSVEYTINLIGMSISPATINTMQLAETITFTVNGGVAPFQWAISDSSVASLTVSGIGGNVATLSAIKSGSFEVTVVDAVQAIIQTAIITVIVEPLVLLPELTTLKINDLVQLMASGGTSPYRWESSNINIISVDGGGLVKAIAGGQATIMVTDNEGKSQSVLVSVIQPLAITGSNTLLGVTETVQFTANGGDGTYTWSSSNPALASIDNLGFITTWLPGFVTITLMDAQGMTDSVVVEIRQVTVTTPISTVTVGAAAFTLTTSGGFGTITWDVSNATVGSVDSFGLFTPLSAGTVVVTVTDIDGFSASATITVNAVAATPATGGNGGGGGMGGGGMGGR